MNKNGEYVFSLDCIDKILKFVEDNGDIDGMYLNLNDYYFYKKDNKIVVRTSNGKNLEAQKETSNVNLGNGVVCYKNIKVKYYLSTGDILKISKTVGILENTKRVADYFEIGYISKSNGSYYRLNWNDLDKKFVSGSKLNEVKGGYIYQDNNLDTYYLSKDLENIISLNGELVLSINDLRKFNLNEEQKKLLDVLKNYQFNEVTKKEIVDLYENLKYKKEYVDKLINAYEVSVIPKAKEIYESDCKINSEIRKSIFNKEQLMNILNELNIKLNSKGLRK